MIAIRVVAGGDACQCHRHLVVRRPLLGSRQRGEIRFRREKTGPGGDVTPAAVEQALLAKKRR
jgi:hypothetical protein